METDWPPKIYRLMEENRVLFSFKGPIYQESLTDMGTLIRRHLDESRRMNALFSIFVELSQNIMRYSREVVMRKGNETGVGLFFLAENQVAYLLSACNLINDQDTVYIRRFFDTISGLDKEQLNALYKKNGAKNRQATPKARAWAFSK